MTDLLNTISVIQPNIQARKYSNEAAVREAIVLPILNALGWATLDPGIVCREYHIEGTRIDYALVAVGASPSVFIEVKAAGQIAGGDRQLFAYAFHQGVPIAILTDGTEWSFYVPGEQGSYDERRVYKLDLLEREKEKACEILRRYLEFDRVRSGAAIEAARGDYRSAAKKREAERSIPKAWRNILDERDELLMELLAEKAENICGFRPSAEQIEKFIDETLIQGKPGLPKPSGQKGPEVDPGYVPLPGDVPQPGSRKITYQLFGRTCSARNSKVALVEILKEMEKRDRAFYEKLSRKVQGTRRNHIAPRKEEVYPERPDLADMAIEISPGWWIGLNIANREKKRILLRACEVLDIEFGKDLMIDFPNA